MPENGVGFKHDYLLVEWYMARLVLKNGSPKSHCYDEIGQRAQNVFTVLGLVVNAIERACVIIQKVWESSMTSCNICISIPIWKFWCKSLWFTVANWMRKFPNQSDDPICTWSSKCPQSSSPQQISHESQCPNWCKVAFKCHWTLTVGLEY